MVALNTTCAPSKSLERSQNRVGDFFCEGSNCVGSNRLGSRRVAKEKSTYSYETASGRPFWPSRDPIGEIGGLNLYGFLNNNPLSKWDWLGLCPDCNAEHDACYAKVEAAKDEMVDNARKTKDAALSELTRQENARRRYCDSLDDGSLIGAAASFSCHAATSAAFGVTRLEVRAVYAALVAAANALEALGKNSCDGALRNCIRENLSNPECKCPKE